MANNSEILSDFEPKGSHLYLIDANILMYLFSPIASYAIGRQETISRFFDKCRSVNSGLITTSSVIGEFFHVNLSIYYTNWCRAQKDQISFDLKKHYRPTEDFKDSVTAINSSIGAILKLTQKFPDNFSNINIDSVLKNCFDSEFTDSYLLELSNQNNWFIVSNDKDLLNHPKRTQLLITPNFN